MTENAHDRAEHFWHLANARLATIEELQGENKRLRSALSQAIAYLTPRVVSGKAGVALMPILHAAMDRAMVNGLTESETNATPSCAGLTVKPWTKWEGGEFPMHPHDTVEIRFDDGETVISMASAFDWEWMCNGKDGDIVAYRIL